MEDTPSQRKSKRNRRDTVEDTPPQRKYPKRNITKVTKYTEYEDSFEEAQKKKIKEETFSDTEYEDTFEEAQKKKIKEESFSEEENEKENEGLGEIDESKEEMSEYEKMRLKNLEENRRIMIELGLIDPNKERKVKLEATKPKPKSSKPKRNPPKPTEAQPIKRSLRLARKTPEGKDVPPDLFQDSPNESLFVEKETRIKEEVLPMGEDGVSTDFLDSLKASLSQDSGVSSIDSTDNLIKDMRALEFVTIGRPFKSRVQSMCVHPMEKKLLMISGGTRGELGLWNASDGEEAMFQPHLGPVNCITVSREDQAKVFTTSFDGTVRRADINKSVFDLVYQTDEKRGMCHVTWHSQLDEHSLLVAHGTGEAGVIDLRTKKPERWFRCHSRSIRTTHLHPTKPYYFLTASGLGESKIFDLRGSKKHVDECVGELTAPKTGKGLTSAFFSPDGNKAVTTSNDDYIRLFDTSDVANPRDIHKIMHDNHTGRWLSVFKANWHPQSSDLFFVGSMLQPRRIQLYSGTGRLVREIMDDYLTTVVPVISVHPTLPVVAAGNSTGKIFLFTTAYYKDCVKSETED